MSKEDINLPKTSFSMKANLPNKEPEILKIWEKIDLFKKLRESRKGKEKFVLHDGPPYANGHIHMGTALNKILKDMVTKFHQMNGKDSVYVPGWDCHGLPIDGKSRNNIKKIKKIKMKFLQKTLDQNVENLLENGLKSSETDGFTNMLYEPPVDSKTWMPSLSFSASSLSEEIRK